MAPLRTSSLGIPGPYDNADSAIIDSQLDQTFYRQLAVVSVHVGISRAVQAARFLAANGREGTVEWKVPGRVALWTGVLVAPGFSDSPRMNVWIFGSPTTQLNVVLLRQGFWALGLARSLSPSLPAL